MPETPAAIDGTVTRLPVEPRYELMPFGSAPEQAAGLSRPARLTMTASPKHGLEKTFELSARLRALGHSATPHLAARMVRSRHHLDALLADAARAGIDDVFVIGGDAAEPAGPYPSAGALLDELAVHPARPPVIGIGAYPEGHPLIDDDELVAALAAKSHHATYIVTQLCFDPQVLLTWLAATRAQGRTLPAYAGVPGPVDRRRLLDISARVGVGPSLSFLRKQRGLTRLFSSPTDAARQLYDALAPVAGDPRLGLAGIHYYTFNELTRTARWHAERETEGDEGRGRGRRRWPGRGGQRGGGGAATGRRSGGACPPSSRALDALFHPKRSPQ